MVAFNSEHSLLIYHVGSKKFWVHISETGWLHCEAQARENSNGPGKPGAEAMEGGEHPEQTANLSFAEVSQGKWHVSQCGEDPPYQGLRLLN